MRHIRIHRAPLVGLLGLAVTLASLPGDARADQPDGPRADGEGISPEVDGAEERDASPPAAADARPVVASCRDRDACRLSGLCYGTPGSCTANDDADCAASRSCAEQGLCSLYQSRCVARSDEQCASAVACQLEGRCRAVGGSCVTRGEAKELGAAPDPASDWQFRIAAEGLDDSGDGRIPFEEGDTVPDGYRLSSEPRYGLVAAGAATTGSLWLISTITAIVLDNNPDGTDDPNFDGNYAPMFIPVAGPFAAIATADSSGTGAAILALNGTLQAAGLAMFLGGFLAPKKYLAPKIGQLQVKPLVSGKMQGVSLSMDL
jgi:hypothetical protein